MFQGEEHRAFSLEGQQGAALLVHGFPGTPAEMRPLAAVLNQAGWTTRGILLPGFGAEIETLGSRTPVDWVESVRLAALDLQRDHSPLLLIGNSMGAALCLQVVAHNADLHPAGLILLSPFWRVGHVLWRMLPVLRFVFPQIRPFGLVKMDFSDPQVRKSIHNFMPDVDLDDVKVQQALRTFSIPMKLLNHIRTVGNAAHRFAPQITCPTLIVQGTDDELVSPKMTRTLMQRFAVAPRYVEVRGGHDVVNPKAASWPAVERAVLDFANGIQHEAER